MSTDESGSGPPPPVPVREILPDPTPQAPPHPVSGPESPDMTEASGEAEVCLPHGDWVIRSGGETRSGVPGDSGAPLQLVLFHRRDPESGAVEAEPAREVWAVGREMEAWDSTKLMELLDRSRPHRALPDPPSTSRSSPPRSASPSAPTPASPRPSPPRPRRLD
ncbi:MAG: hypothetical protein EA422_10395 [Gemmatimonadales bacterium]|nr:MAG: hypothetical protein EA422_10395 [Gemmatimonadales bacterium]